METPARGSNQPPPLPRNWWSRNWKWFVPTGCLTLVVFGAGFVVGILYLVTTVMKSSDVYKGALARAKGHPAVIEALGEPIEEGWFTTGKTEVTGTTGSADIGIPISGPKGKGTIYAVATKSAGRWSYNALLLEVSGQPERIDLLSGEASLEQ